MGGLYSGRKRRHTSIDDCIELDIAHLRKIKLIGQENKKMSLECKKWRETDFVKRTEQSHNLSAFFLAEDTPTLTLTYQTVWTNEYGSKKAHDHGHVVTLVSTPCNYGGVRWWFKAPCCKRRVRVLYINLRRGDIENMTPQCRLCLNLHYGSQMASYIERHKTYERHLLANYGLYWAYERYNYELKEHYLKMTPELYALRANAVIDWNIHTMKLLIRCDLMIMRDQMRAFKTLKSEEDRRLWIEQMQQTQRELHTADTVRLILALIENEKAELHYRLHRTDVEADKLEETQLHFLQESERFKQREQEDNQEEPTEHQIEQRIIDLEGMLKQVNQLDKAA